MHPLYDLEQVTDVFHFTFHKLKTKMKILAPPTWRAGVVEEHSHVPPHTVGALLSTFLTYSLGSGQVGLTDQPHILDPHRGS